jgi:hypothetical protein
LQEWQETTGFRGLDFNQLPAKCPQVRITSAECGLRLTKKYFRIVEFIPIIAFGWVVRLTNENAVNWKLAFIVGACIALLERSLLVAKRLPLDRLLLGVDMFLVVGGAGFLFNITFILLLYERLMQATLFAFVLVVGILTTFLTERGFLGIRHHERSQVLSYSLYLIGAGVVAFLVSFAFRGNYLLAGVIPFTGMIVAKSILAKRLRKPELNKPNR